MRNPNTVQEYLYLRIGVSGWSNDVAHAFKTSRSFCSTLWQGSTSADSTPTVPASTSEAASSFCALKAPATSPRIIHRNWELEGLKADASSFLIAAARASASTKGSSIKSEPKFKTTVKVVRDSQVPGPSSSTTMAYQRVRLPPCSRKITATISKESVKIMYAM
ncbi:hypothetical protein EV359DRAFT_85898 [Lentinula novae-zelandiae]|nr:hypothetical protein EV359DRAFT_85898 [Lentinula novae-zelandiae]